MASEVRADAETAESSGVDSGPELGAENAATDQADQADQAGPATGDHGTAAAAEPAEPENVESTVTSEAVEAPGAGPAAEGSNAEKAEQPTGPAAPVARKPRRLPVLIAVAALALAIDVISKLLVVQHLTDREPIHVPGGFLNLVLYRNSGAAFSIGEGQTWVFTIIAAAVVVVILRVSRNLRSLPWACALGLLLGGALGNLSDRIFREPGLFRGHVVDFLQFPTFPVVHYDFPVFNLADSAIVTGGCLMVLLSFLGMQPDGTRHGAVSGDGSASGDAADAVSGSTESTGGTDSTDSTDSTGGAADARTDDSADAASTDPSAKSDS